MSANKMAESQETSGIMKLLKVYKVEKS